MNKRPVLSEIWKYHLEKPDNEISMPKGATVLSAQNQGGLITIWVMLDPLEDRETRLFSVYGTGWQIKKSNRKFIGTVQLDNGLVFHVFEEIEQ